jgi:drug/metabolite transporter (DMT)-like permease
MAIWHWSIRLTTVANATLLVNFAPIFVTLGSWLLFRQRVSLTFMLGMAAALLGATLLIGASFSLSMHYFWGDFLALIAAAFYAGYLLSVKYLRDAFSTSTLLAWSGVAICLALLPVSLLSGEVLLPVSSQGWLVLLGLALMIHVGGQGLIAFAMAHLPAAFSSVTLLIQPVMASVFAWVILNEALGPWQALGGLIVLPGIFVARRGSRAG